MQSKVFISKLQNIVDNYKTVYMWGVFGSPVTDSIITSKSNQYLSWYNGARRALLRPLIGKGYFGFDCVNLIKGILWGWNGDASKANGGAVHNSNGVPDTNADGMIRLCEGVSTDFSGIIPGEAVWMEGHIGVYIGGGKVIESTPIWNNGVQVSACLNIGAIAGLNGRKWKKHGKLPFIEYEVITPAPEQPKQDSGTYIRVLMSKTGEIRTMDIEEYLRGVVPSEMYSFWDPEALKAQAVASRSYALVKMKQNASKDYDVDDTTQYQAYRTPVGVNHNTDEAVEATRGEVLIYNGSIAEAVFSASNGGKMLSAKAVWGGDVPYLIEQADPFDKNEKHGHGVGMSQNGAQGRALAGYNYKNILSFYFPGTVLGRLCSGEPDAKPEFIDPQKAGYEITVDNTIKDGVLMDRPLWLKILRGEITADPERIKAAFDRYHIKYAGGSAGDSIAATVDNAISDDVLMDRELWLKILSGEITAEPDRIKTAFDRYHIRLVSKEA